MKPLLFKAGYPFLKIYWFVVRPSTFGVKCIVEWDGKILLIRNTYGKWGWTFPGGGIKKGESLEDAVRREVKEETGIEIVDLKNVEKFFMTWEYKRDTITVFTAKAASFTIEPQASEIAAAQWFDKQSLPELSSFAQKIWLKINR
jgi:ADP-ribose pyrophosphatase YjhB (NUDIX family)